MTNSMSNVIYVLILLPSVHFCFAQEEKLILQLGLPPFINEFSLTEDEKYLFVGNQAWDLSTNKEFYIEDGSLIESSSKKKSQVNLQNILSRPIFGGSPKEAAQRSLYRRGLSVSAISLTGQFYALTVGTGAGDLDNRGRIRVGKVRDKQIVNEFHLPINFQSTLVQPQFTLDGNFLTVMSTDGNVFIVDWREGQILEKINLNEEKPMKNNNEDVFVSQVPSKYFSNLIIQPDLNYFVAIEDGCKVIFYDLIDQVNNSSFSLKGCTEQENYNSRISSIGFTPGEQYLYTIKQKTEKPYNNTILEIRDKRMGTVLQSFSQVRNCEFSNDGKLLYVSSWILDGKEYKGMNSRIYEMGSFKELTKIEEAGVLHFSQNNSSRIAYLSGNGLVIRNLKEEELKEGVNKVTSEPARVEARQNRIYSYNLNTVTNEIFIGDNGNVKRLNLNTLEVTSYPYFSGPTGIHVSSDQKFIAINHYQNAKFHIDLYNQESDKLYTIKGPGELSNFSIDHNSQYLIASIKQGSGLSFQIYSLNDGKKVRDIPIVSRDIMSYQLYSNKLVLSLNRFMQIDIIDIYTGELLHSYPGFHSFSFSSDEKMYALQNNQEIRIYETQSERLILSIPFLSEGMRAGVLKFSPDNKQLGLFYQGKFYLYSLKNGKLLKSIDLGETNSFVIDPPWKTIISSESVARNIKMFDLHTGQEKCRIFPIGREDFIITTPDNYYCASKKGAVKGVAFEIGNETFSYDQFDLKYNRPDIVLDRLGFVSDTLIDIYHLAYLKRLEKMSINEQSLSKNLSVPTVKFLSQLPTFTKEKEISFEVLIEDTNEFLDRLHVIVNGVPEYSLNGYSLKHLSKKTHQQLVDLQLNNGLNTIEIEALNQAGNYSKRASHVVTLETQVVKPDLYFIGIGIEEFNDPALNLSYPVKDLQDLRLAFEAKSKDYSRMVLKTLHNKEVTSNNLDAIKKLLQKSKVDDHVILFVAGHGFIDTNLNYFFVTPKMDFDNPKETGISYDYLEALLDGIPARQKLFLMDACHSGELDSAEVKLVENEFRESNNVKFRAILSRKTSSKVGSNNIFNLMKSLFVDLRRNTGTTVISSAGGVEFAIEGGRWQNSVFTHSLLSGLIESKADLNADGKIMVSELQGYTAKQVSKLTKGRQKPTFRVENITRDWQIW